jgi:hypothetical protein
MPEQSISDLCLGCYSGPRAIISTITSVFLKLKEVYAVYFVVQTSILTGGLM